MAVATGHRLGRNQVLADGVVPLDGVGDLPVDPGQRLVFGVPGE